MADKVDAMERIKTSRFGQLALRGGAALGLITTTALGNGAAHAERKVEPTMGPQGTALSQNKTATETKPIPGPINDDKHFDDILRQNGLKLGRTVSRNIQPNVEPTPTIEGSDTTFLYSVHDITNERTTALIRTLRTNQLSIDQFNSLFQGDIDQNSILQDETLVALVSGDLKLAQEAAGKNNIDPSTLDTKIEVFDNGQTVYVFPTLWDGSSLILPKFDAGTRIPAGVRRLTPQANEHVGFILFGDNNPDVRPAAWPLIYDSNGTPLAAGFEDTLNPNSIDLTRKDLTNVSLPTSSFQAFNEAGMPTQTIDPNSLDVLYQVQNEGVTVVDNTYLTYVFHKKTGEWGRIFTTDLSKRSVPAEVLSSAPQSVLMLEGNNVVSQSVQYKTENGQLVGVNQKGEVVVGMFPGVEMYNDAFIKQVSIDGPIPFTLWMSAAFTSKDNVVNNIKSLPTVTPVDQLGLRTSAGIIFHDTSRADLRNGWGDGTYSPGPLPAEYHGQIPQNGSDILRVALEAAVAKASKDGGKTVVLPNGSVWVVVDGVEELVRRNPSKTDVGNIISSRKRWDGFLIQPELSVDPMNGKLQIRTLQPDSSGGSVSGDLLNALSMLVSPYDKSVETQVDPYGNGIELLKNAPWLTHLFYPTDGKDGFTWVFDSATSDQNIAVSNNNNFNWTINAK